MSDSPRWIEVLVSPAGETRIATKGFAGPACQQATRALEAALGKRQSETLTAEFHQTVSQETGLAARTDGVA